MGKVTFVGAGPGDPALITVKGMEKLKNCDAVIYDRLSSEELLCVVREDCELVYVGKKPGAHSKKQEEINRILVAYASKYENVVRLKGGDSFVFGRGGEEICALQAAGIPFEVIPGITSSIAVPELAGIPVTHRGKSQSFHVMTGHTKDGAETLTDDYETLAKLDGTLIFLMGMSNLEKITERLMYYGKSGETPAAVIAKGTTPEERTVRGTLADLAGIVREAELEAPAVIVIGETAGLHLKLDGSAQERQTYNPDPAQAQIGAARKYGVIGTAKTVSRFVQELDKYGEKAVPLMEMEACRTKETAELAQEIERISAYTWILFTSKQAVDVFFREYFGKRADIRELARCRFGVIGQGTKEALWEYGIRADFMPDKADSESFAKAFLEIDAGQLKEAVNILIPRAKQGSGVLQELLRKAGFTVREISVYDVAGKSNENFLLAAQLSDFVFFSASGVRAFFAELKKRRMELKQDSHFYCMGRLTESALEEELTETDGNASFSSDRVSVIAAQPQTMEGLVHKIVECR